MPSIAFLFLLIITTIKAHVFRFYLQPPAVAQVTPLVEGKIERIQQGSVLVSSVTLIEDGGYYIIVDSPSATDLSSKEKMLKGLMSRNLVPGQVQMIITTHGHPDHFGQGNFFPNARHFFASYEYTGTSFLRTELYQAEIMKLTKNTELWNTPGHTSQDVSIIVRNTKCCGTIAVVGDLFYSEKDAMSSKEWDMDAWDSVTGHLNRRRVICIADWIVPGHGAMFKITDEMRQSAHCEGLIVRKTLVSVTHPGNTAASTAVLPLSQPSRPPTRATTTTYPERTSDSRSYQINNSILPEDSGEKKSHDDLTKSSEGIQKNLSTQSTEKSFEETAQTSTITEVQFSPTRKVIKASSESTEVLPVTAAQDITQFFGTSKEKAVSNKTEPQQFTETIMVLPTTAQDEENNEEGNLVGAIVYPTQTVPQHTETGSLPKKKNSESGHVVTVKRSDNLFSAEQQKGRTPVQDAAVQMSEEKPQTGLFPVLESAASQIASYFNNNESPEGTSDSGMKTSYMDMLQNAINKIMMSTAPKAAR